ncbi:EamA family transporter [Frateuria defendens]|uniref:EamA family transporter n=1 Tax=Frateuria defendens TaxID=2219559 RepID=UPI00066FD71E|nr:EamA family transporter [Frateuria defendens]
MSQRAASSLLPVGTLLLGMLSFQCGAALAKQLFPLVGAQGATAMRLGLGALILWLLRRPWRRLAGRQGWGALWGYGLTLGLMNLSFYMALRTIPLGIAVALEFVGPLAIALFGSRRALDVLWVALVMAGLALLLPWRGHAQALDPVGVLYAMGAAVGWAAYILLGRRAGAAFGGDAVALGSAIGALVAVPVGVAHAGAALFAPAALPFALGVAVLSSALPYSLEMIALTRLPARTVGILLSIEPALGAVLGLLFLDERLSLLQWLAIAAIIAASIGAVLGARKPPADLAAAAPLAD